MLTKPCLLAGRQEIFFVLATFAKFRIERYAISEARTFEDFANMSTIGLSGKIPS
jgi:hypothetical protein